MGYKKIQPINPFLEVFTDDERVDIRKLAQDARAGIVKGEELEFRLGQLKDAIENAKAGA